MKSDTKSLWQHNTPVVPFPWGTGVGGRGFRICSGTIARYVAKNHNAQTRSGQESVAGIIQKLAKNKSRI